MKRKGIIVLIIALCILGGGLLMFMVAAMTGHLPYMNLSPFHKNLELANSERISVSQVDNIRISYLSDSITFYQGEDENLVLEEYMNNWTEAMFATVTQEHGVISIQCGERPKLHIMGGLQTHIKVYLPKSYRGDLEVSVSSGGIRSQQSFTLNSVDLSSKSGSINLNTIQTTGACQLTSSSGSIRVHSIIASQLNLTASSGSIAINKAVANTITGEVSSGRLSVEDAEGIMDLTSKSGSLHVTGRGSGKFKTSSGRLSVDLKAVNGDIHATSNSGSVSLKLPKNLSFAFQADTNSGSIRTDFDDLLSFNRKGNSASGQIGSNADLSITLSASSGGIRVSQ